MKLLPFLFVTLVGCSTFHAVQDETAPDGTQRRTDVRAKTFMDSKSNLGNLRTTMTDKSQGIGIGSLSQESYGSNAVNVAKAIMEAAIEAAIRAAAKP